MLVVPPKISSRCPSASYVAEWKNRGEGAGPEGSINVHTIVEIERVDRVRRNRLLRGASEENESIARPIVDEGMSEAWLGNRAGRDDLGPLGSGVERKSPQGAVHVEGASPLREVGSTQAIGMAPASIEGETRVVAVRRRSACRRKGGPLRFRLQTELPDRGALTVRIRRYGQEHQVAPAES